MSGIQVSAKLTGADAAIRKFATLEKKIANKITKDATRQGLTPFLKGVRNTTKFKDKSGGLRKSFAKSVRSGRGKDKGSIVGKVKSRVTGRWNTQHGPPWILEHGHRIAVGKSGMSEKNVVLKRIGKDRRAKKLDQRYGTSGGFVSGRFYGRDAFTRTNGQAKATFTSRWVSDVMREASANG
jgi:hypothetical protein